MKKVFILLFTCTYFWAVAQKDFKDDIAKVKVITTKSAIVQQGNYIIKSAIEGKNMDVMWGENKNGAGIHLWDAVGNDAQTFTIEPSNESGYYHIKSKWGRALDVIGSSNASGASLQTYDLQGGNNQKWKFIDVGNGYYNIQSKLGTYIDVKGASSASGTQIWMSAYSNFGNNVAQRWKLEKTLIYIDYIPIFPTNKGVQTSISDRQGENRETRVGDATMEEKPGMVCTTQKISFSESNFERLIAGGIEEKVYPGAFYDGSSIAQGRWQSYAIARSPMRIGLVDVSGTTGNLQATIIPENGMIDRGIVANGIQTILQSNRNMRNAAANTFVQKEIFSANQLEIFIGGSFSGWGVTASATFNLNKRTEQRNVICKITQKYFTIDVPTGSSRQLLQNPNDNIDDNAVYISSVSYGRIGYLSIKSTLSTEDIRVAVNAIYSNPSMTAGLAGSVNISNFLRNSEFNGFTYGGDPITVTNINDFFRYIKAGEFRDNNIGIKPIFYKTKFLKSGKDAFVSMITEYNEVQCEPYKTLELTFKGPSLSGLHNGDCRKVWGTVDVEAWETTNGTLTKRILPITESGQREDVTRMMEWPNNHVVKNITDAVSGWTAVNSVNKTWSFRINPNKINSREAVFIVKTYLGSEHKWSDISNDYTPNAGMSGVETKSINILDVLQAKANNSFNNIDGPMVAGPYTSPYRTDHHFRAHFDINLR